MEQYAHAKICCFTSVPDFLANIIENDDKANKPLDDDEGPISNSFLSFNSNVGLKSRLYHKHKELMQKALNKTPPRERDVQKDDFMDLIEAHILKRSESGNAEAI